MVVASLWLADTISHEWGVFAISAAFAGNAGCLYLHLSE
jgi:ABC-type branched-subunit amino acid transport system permease subunit